MSMFPHKTKSSRRIITVQEWADYIGVTRVTMASTLKKYQQLFTYDPRDIYSVLDFFTFLLGRKSRKQEKTEK